MSISRSFLVSLVAILIVSLMASTSFAQQPVIDSNAQQPDIDSTATPASDSNLFKRVFKDIYNDQKAIYNSPFTVKKRNLKFIIPFAAVTATLISTDEQVNKVLSKQGNFVSNSGRISNIGSFYTMFGTAGAFYLAGKISGNDHIKKTGGLGLEALTDSLILSSVLKTISRRERPDKSFQEGRFLVGGRSFPSGHAVAAWSLATVVAEQYSDKPLIKFGAYGLATLVSISRISGQKHFPSDAVVGSMIGYLVGRYVVKHHKKHP